MADPTGFVLKVSELPRIIEVLSYQGVVPVSAVAKEVGRTEDEVRDLLVRYYVTEDAEDRLGLPPPIEFLDDLGEDAEPSAATNVRLHDRYVVDDLAFDYAPVEYLARVYRVARDESLLEPDNARPRRGRREAARVPRRGPHAVGLHRGRRALRGPVVPGGPRPPPGPHPVRAHVVARGRRAGRRAVPGGAHPAGLGGRRRPA